MFLKIINYKIMFLVMMIVGTMICVSSNSWMAMWLGLELNLLSFIPIMIVNKNILTSEASLKYFLVQAMASSMFLMSIIMTMIMYEINTMNFFNISNITFIVMIMKLGSAPLHFWFPSVMEGLSWMNCFILMSWQKIAPFAIMSYLNIFPNLLFTFIVTSIIIGSVGGLNQTSLHKLMAYSSISHLGWMILALQISNSMWLIYFSIYSFMSLSIILIFSYTLIHHLSHTVLKFSMSKELKMILSLNLLSLGGLPPFIGFLPKLLVIQSSPESNLVFLNFILVMFTLVTLLFYIRVCLSSFLMNSTLPKWKTNTKYNIPASISILSSLSLLGLLVYPLITFS